MQGIRSFGGGDLHGGAAALVRLARLGRRARSLLARARRHADAAALDASLSRRRRRRRRRRIRRRRWWRRRRRPWRAQRTLRACPQWTGLIKSRVRATEHGTPCSACTCAARRRAHARLSLARRRPAARGTPPLGGDSPGSLARPGGARHEPRSMAASGSVCDVLMPLGASAEWRRRLRGQPKPSRGPRGEVTRRAASSSCAWRAVSARVDFGLTLRPLQYSD